MDMVSPSFLANLSVWSFDRSLGATCLPVRTFLPNTFSLRASYFVPASW